MKLIHMVGFSDIGKVDIGKDEVTMIKDKLVDGKKLLIDLKVFYYND